MKNAQIRHFCQMYRTPCFTHLKPKRVEKWVEDFRFHPPNKIFLFLRFCAFSIVVICATDAQNHAEKRVNRRDCADYLFAVGEAPDATECEIQRAQRGQKVKCNPLQKIVAGVRELHFHHSFQYHRDWINDCN